MSNTIETVFDHTTDFATLAEATIEATAQEINAKLKLRNQHPPVPMYTVQVILPHGEHADLEKIYKYIAAGTTNTFTALEDQTTWTPDLATVVTQAAEIAPQFDFTRIVYKPEPNDHN